VGGKASVDIGKNFYPLVQSGNGQRKYSSYIQFEKASGVYELATTQLHHSMEGRALIREASLEEYKIDPAAGNEMHEEIEKHLDSLYDKHAYEGHHWGMSVNLTSCTGCNACVVACISENNIPVVGKEQVKMGREMHWIRIDRYYSGDPENPEVSRQPVMCQHCDNAPCENVCPVSATTHSTEGINQMIYNRCVGTRYCNNNCPYKVRRFNWLDFNQADAIPQNTYDPMDLSLDLSRMVLNPDVTVRAKGVMEKCSFCIQRIQERKLEAKLEGRPLRDGEIKSACQQVCPTEAITFGDLSDKKSELSELVSDERSYHLLEEIHTLPSVSYLTRIRNKSDTT
jgi:molybdopterin-containing oxidoreductase family iron-sulfur binding subunit